MEVLSSEEECCEVGFWNNWWPSPVEVTGCIPRDTSENGDKNASEIIYNFSNRPSSNYVTENLTFRNWIPPANFLNSSSGYKQNLSPETNSKQFKMQTETSNVKQNGELRKNRKKVLKINKKICGGNWSEVKALNWEERIQLHDVTELNEGDFAWGVVNLGIFSNIKVWVNEYDNICCSAKGELSKIGSSEITYIFITDPQLLRKMLRISAAQWVLLCESVQEKKINLNFSAFEDFELSGKTPLEKLWFFICKRRHFLPRQCMLVKVGGAVKCLRKFSIAPKVLVQDITMYHENHYFWKIDNIVALKKN